MGVAHIVQLMCTFQLLCKFPPGGVFHFIVGRLPTFFVLIEGRAGETPWEALHRMRVDF